jgi:hypothetical protein
MPILKCPKCQRRWETEPKNDKTEFDSYCDNCRELISARSKLNRNSSEIIVSFLMKAFTAFLFTIGFGLILYGLWLYFREGIIFYIGIFLMLWANKIGRRLK